MLSIETMSGNDETGLVRRACERLTAQRFVPMSPGRMDTGEVLLCAGAALVREAVVKRRSEREGDEFARDVVSRDSGHIREVGTLMGLDPAMVSGAIIMNDSLPARKRLTGVVSWFRRYRESAA